MGILARGLFWFALPLWMICAAGLAHGDDPRANGGMLAWPDEEMARALGIFVPDQMKASDVPGVALAIVKDGQIVYTATFGKADRRAQNPVTPDTRFEAGELGETLAAFAALDMAGDKLLFLDAPLSRDLDAPWMSNPEDDAQITLRHVLQHRSGLGDNVAHPAWRTRFEPGSAFSHSGVGFLYLQHVMEVIGGKPFDALMRERVFGPLGMNASTYLPDGAADGTRTQGYVPLSFLLTLYFMPMGIAFAILIAAFWGIARFLLQRRLEPVDLIWSVLASSLFAMVVVWWGLGLQPALFVIGLALLSACVIAMLGGFAYYLLYIVGLARARDGIISRGRSNQEGIVVLVAGAIALAGFVPALGWSVPVMRLSALDGEKQANVASSFQTTAPDMARFMIAVMDGTHLSPSIRRQMFTDRAPVDEVFSWSLLAGLRHDATIETIWTRGSALGFESLMVMDPARQAGVVVLTNSRAGGELAQEVARNVLGVEAVWSLP